MVQVLRFSLWFLNFLGFMTLFQTQHCPKCLSSWWLNHTSEKYSSKWTCSQIFGVNIKNPWNHNLVMPFDKTVLFCSSWKGLINAYDHERLQEVFLFLHLLLPSWETMCLEKKWFNIFRKNSRFQKYINPPKKLTHVPLKKDYFNRKYRVHLPITIDFQGTRFLLSLQFKTAPNWSRVPPWPLAAEVLGHCLRKGRSVNVGQSPRGNVSLHTPPLIISNLQSVTIST